MNWFQTFKLDNTVVDYVLGNLTVTLVDQINCIPVDIPEIPIEDYARKYMESFKEYNYFIELDKLGINKELYLVYTPPGTFRNWQSVTGRHFTVYIFLNDSDLVYEFFDPFSSTTRRFKAVKGLVVILPSIWMIVGRHTSTRATHAIFIMGSIGITDLDNMHQSGSSNVTSESSVVQG